MSGSRIWFDRGEFVAPTKLLPPPLRTEHVSRDRLLERLSVDTLPSLAVVSAPAGYGKSTLLAELARGSDCGVFAWISLDREDTDPARFWLSVVAALAQIQPEQFSELVPFAARGADADASLLPRLVECASTLDTRVVTVLDDYHQLTRSPVHAQLDRLIERSPAQLRVVIGTRADPPLRLARLRAAGELVEIRAADLRFTLAEATTFLNDRLMLDLSARELGMLDERAEGWVGALYLAALSVSQHPERAGFIESFAGTNRFIVDYLADEVMTQLSEESRDFLLRCSALGSLTGPLVDHVLERTGSSTLLRELERSNMFVIPLDEDRVWYRFHHLFADLLRAELQEREPGLLATLHGRASQWFSERNLVHEAIEHALASGNASVAGRLIAESFWPCLHRGQVKTVHRWLDGMPSEHVCGDPRLCVVAAWASVYLGRPSEVSTWLARAEEADHDGIAMPAGLGSVAAAVSLVRAGVADGDVGKQVRAGREAVLREYDDAMWTWIADGSLGIALFWAGETAESRMRISRVAVPLAEADLPQAACLAHAYLALIELEGPGNGIDAHHQAALALALAAEHHLDDETDTGVAYLARGMAERHSGALPSARTDLTRAVALLSRGSNTLEHAFAQIELARVLEFSGMREEARALLEDVSSTLAGVADEGILAGRLAQMRERVGMPGARILVSGPSMDLTERELEVLAYLPGPLSQREIGAALWVSFNTVASHIRSIYRKLGVSSRHDAVVRARELELL